MGTEIQTLAFGVVTGSYLIVATIGFALVARVEKFLNVAHAELILGGAFVTYALTRLGWALPAAAVTAVLAVALAAAIVAKTVYWPIRRRSQVVLLITSVGVLFVLNGVIELATDAGTHSFDVATPALLDFGLFELGAYDLAIVVVAMLTVLAVHLVLTRTPIGLRWRALASDEELAEARGVDAGRSSLYLWLLVGALAGLAGVLLGLQGPVYVDLGFRQILLILSVAILAGLGSVYGVVVAALLVGIAMDMSTLILPPGYREAVAFSLVFVVLILRPQGLFGHATARLRGG